MQGRALRSLQIERWTGMLSAAMVLDRRFIQDLAVTLRRRGAPAQRAEIFLPLIPHQPAQTPTFPYLSSPRLSFTAETKSCSAPKYRSVV
jgi:hypothetical protein